MFVYQGDVPEACDQEEEEKQTLSTVDSTVRYMYLYRTLQHHDYIVLIMIFTVLLMTSQMHTMYMNSYKGIGSRYKS